jgi:hypothetical protein
MAITTLPPSETTTPLRLLPEIVRTKSPARPPVIARGSKVFLRILPDLKVAPGEQTSSRGFILILGAIVIFNVLALLAINTVMTSDAFVLERLKLQTNIANDQRDAVLKLAEVQSSPDRLAASATKLGMIPAKSIVYLDGTKLPDAAVNTLVVP